MKGTRRPLAFLALSTACACGGAGIPPSSVGAEAHLVASEATAGRGDVKQCLLQPDSGACEQANTDFCDIISQAKELEGLAVDAGYTPTQPIVPCPKK